MPAATMPTRSGYTFEGYYDATTGGTQYYTRAGASARVWNKDAATTLYARWTQCTACATTNADCTMSVSGNACTYATSCKTGYNGGTANTYNHACAANTYTVTYAANGGTGTTASSSHSYGTSKALTANGFTNGTKQFLGWSTSSSATTATYTNAQSVSNLTATNGGTVALYAVWKACAACATTNASCQQNNLTAPALTCSYTTACDTGFTGGTANTYNHSCTAKTYTITLNANGGTLGSATSITATFGQTMPQIVSGLPTRSNFIFNGFWSAASGGVQYIKPDGLPTTATWTTDSAASLYAQWIEFGLWLGGKKIGRIFIGGKEVKEAYMNGEKVFSK
jgi:hypothetical protein